MAIIASFLNALAGFVRATHPLPRPGTDAPCSPLRASATRPPRSAFFLCVIVERAKKCLDFATTAHFLHLCFCVLYATSRTDRPMVPLRAACARAGRLARSPVVLGPAAQVRWLARLVGVVGGQRDESGHDGARRRVSLHATRAARHSALRQRLGRTKELMPSCCTLISSECRVASRMHVLRIGLLSERHPRSAQLRNSWIHVN